MTDVLLAPEPTPTAAFTILDAVDRSATITANGGAFMANGEHLRILLSRVAVLARTARMLDITGQPDGYSLLREEARTCA